MAALLETEPPSAKNLFGNSIFEKRTLSERGLRGTAPGHCGLVKDEVQPVPGNRLWGLACASW